MKKQVITKNSFKCTSPTLTSAKIRNFQEILNKNEKLAETVRFAEITSGEMRAKILYLLARESWLSVCDIADILTSSVTSTSHQLAILRKESLVRTKKKERLVLYALATQLPSFFETILGQ